VHILVLDWGIGGIDAWDRLRRLRPSWSTTYVSDGGFTPYGKVASADLAARLVAVVAAAGAGRDLGPTGGFDAVVVACNAASTILDVPSDYGQPVLGAGQHVLAVPTFGVIEPGIQAALASGHKRVAIIGGQRTIDAAIHAERLTALGFDVRAAVAQPLSAHVEEGRLTGPEVTSDVADVVAALTDDGWAPDALLLACTHYPALAPLFAAALPETRLLDPADALVEAVARWAGSSASSRPPSHAVMTTGDGDAMRLGARLAFGVSLPPEIRHLRGV